MYDISAARSGNISKGVDKSSTTLTILPIGQQMASGSLCECMPASFGFLGT